MAQVIFFEKTGCAGNARQKALLEASCHQVEARDLRDRYWSDVDLLRFLAGLPIGQWFHPAAPAIKSGEIVPEQLDMHIALGLLRHNPLLIRRPLLQVGEERRVGFDPGTIRAWIGLKAVPDENPEACPKDVDGPACCVSGQAV